MHDTSHYDETELIPEMLKGDMQAFEKIYHLYSPKLYCHLIKMVKSEVEAREILQDVFFKVWCSRELIDTEKSFRSYLFKIAENKVYDFFRKAARNKKRQDRLQAIATLEYVHFEEKILSKENAAILLQAIEALPPQRRQVFGLCKLEDKSYKEVSELLGISVSTISDHIVKATKSIRLHFQNYEQILCLLFFLNLGCVSV